MGRPKKTRAQKVLNGLDDVRSRRTTPEYAGAFKEPAHLDNEALAYWRKVAPMLERAGVTKASDEFALEAMARTWSQWIAACDLYAENPDPRNRTTVLGFLNAWRSQAERFGLNPMDRARVEVDPPATDEGADFDRQVG